MAAKVYNRFWVSVTALITLVLLAILFPILLDKYGLGRALLLSCLIPIAMALAYLRGYWVSTWLSRRNK